MKTETVSVDSITLDPANLRKHGERNIETIRASLSRFGQQHPIIVNHDGVVIAGNGRLQAMRSLGWKECDVVRTDLAGAEAVAFAIADNRTAELAEWDDDALASILQSLDNKDRIDAGFDDDEIARLIGEVEAASTDFPDLADGDREPFQQMTFVLHDDQVESVRAAIQKAKGMGPFVDTGNENSNGNALARVAEMFCG